MSSLSFEKFFESGLMKGIAAAFSPAFFTGIAAAAVGSTASDGSVAGIAAGALATEGEEFDCEGM